jgi:hypothetical protein
MLRGIFSRSPMRIDKLPPDSSDLVAQLDAAFPPECIRKGQSLEDAHRYAGKRELVEFLIELKRRADSANPM